MSSMVTFESPLTMEYWRRVFYLTLRFLKWLFSPSEARMRAKFQEENELRKGRSIRDSLPFFTDIQSLESRQEVILNQGTVGCPTTSVMFLGDSGVGKTSTCRHLLGKEHVSVHNHTVGIDAKTAQWTHATQDWCEVDVKPDDGWKLKQVLAYSLVKSQEENVDITRNVKRNSIYYTSIFYVVIIMTILSWTPFLNYIWTYFEHKRKMKPEEMSPIFTMIYAVGFELVLFIDPSLLTNQELIFKFLLRDRKVDTTLERADQCNEKILKQGYNFLGFCFFPAISLFCSIFDEMLSFDLRNVRYYGAVSLFVISELMKLVCICYLYVIRPDDLFFHSTRYRRVKLVDYYFGKIYIIIFLLIYQMIVYSEENLSSPLFFPSVYLNAWIVSLFVKYCLEGSIRPTEKLNFILGIFQTNSFLLYPFLVEDDSQLILILFALHCLLMILIGEYIEGIARTSIPVRQIMDHISGEYRHWPAVLGLLDCAGDPVYHSAHHIFMARYALYLIVFRLPDLIADFDATEARIIYWMNSVLQHAPHPDARMVLVATHKMSVDAEEGQQAIERLSGRLTPRYRSRVVSEDDGSLTSIFAIDNLDRDACENKLSKLKEVIWNHCLNAEYVRRPVRATWFAFLVVIDELRQESQHDPDNPNWAVVHIERLWSMVHKRCRLKQKSDFYRMLSYFNDCGEIFYNSDDPNLRQYAVLDMQVIIDCIKRLIPTDIDASFDGGISTPQTAECVISRSDLLSRVPGYHDVVISVMVELGIVVPIQSGCTDMRDYFLLPHLLRRRSGHLTLLKHPKTTAAFSFNTLPKQTLFLQLLALCYGFGVRNPFPHCQLFANEGVFVFDNGLSFRLRLDIDANRCRIWMQCMEVEQIVSTEICDLLRYLDQLVSYLCSRYFETVEYTVDMVCPCSTEKDLDEETIDLLTIVDHRQSSKSQQSFPTSTRHYLCRSSDDLVSLPFRPSMNALRVADPLWDSCTATDVDAFISCSEQDRHFALKYLMPVSENWLPHQFENNHVSNTAVREPNTGVSMSINLYDDPCPDAREWMPLSISRRYMEHCKCVIVLLSHDYLTSLRCCHEMDMAQTLNKPIIVVRRDPSISVDSLLFNTSSIDWPGNGVDSFANFFPRLIRSIKNSRPRE